MDKFRFFWDNFFLSKLESFTYLMYYFLISYLVERLANRIKQLENLKHL